MTPATKLLTLTALLPLAVAPAYAQSGGWNRDVAQLKAQIGADIRDSLRRFEGDPGATCESPDYAHAADGAIHLERRAEESGADMDTMLWSLSLLLDVADAAKAKGCTDDARDIYDEVASTYTAPGYETVRQRAEAGLAGTD